MKSRSSHVSVASLAFVLGALAPGTSVQAQQFVNGEFESGPAAWAWKKAETSHLNPCDDLAAFSAGYVNTPQNIMGSDRAARVTHDFSYGSSIHVCGQIEQEVFVPIGARLKFDYRIGDPTYAYTSAPGAFSMIAEDVQLGIEKRLTTASGSNCRTGSQWCNPPVVSKNLDISRYWGRVARLKFRGSSWGSKGGVSYDHAPTMSYVDSVRLEMPTLSQAKPRSGGYYNPSRSGQGIHISKSPDGQYSLIWYTFLPNGEPVWYMSDIAYHQGGVWQAGLYKFTWNTQSDTRNPGQLVGDVRLESLSSTKLNFMWDFHSDGDIAGYDSGEPMQFLTGNEGYTGMWYEPALSGWGFTADHEVGDSTSTTVFYYDGAKPVWAYSSKSGDPVGGATATLYRYTSTGLCPTCKFEPVSRSAATVGEIGLNLESNQGWFVAEGEHTDWQRGSSASPSALSRLTYP